MVLTAYGVRAPERPAFVSPSPADSSSADLAPATRAPGPHALAVRFTSHVWRRSASIASRAPRLVTIGRTPLLVEAGRFAYSLIFISEKEKYFRADGLTRIRKICPSGKSNWVKA